MKKRLFLCLLIVFTVPFFAFAGGTAADTGTQVSVSSAGTLPIVEETLSFSAYIRKYPWGDIDYDNNLAAAWLIALAWTIVGCTPDDGRSARDLFPRAAGEEDRTVTVVRVHVTAVEVPIGTAGESTILWGLLDREVMALDEDLLLSDNGLRVGVGPREDWGRLEDVLVDMSGRQHEPITVIGLPGAPVPVVVGRHATTRTVFLVHADDTISGADYPPGSYIISLLPELDPDGRTLTVTALPQVESTHRKPMVVSDSGAPAMVRRPISYSLYPLAFQMRINTGDFIVIAPSARAARETSVGRNFLVRDRDGIPVETILVITPEVVTKEIQ